MGLPIRIKRGDSTAWAQTGVTPDPTLLKEGEIAYDYTTNTLKVAHVESGDSVRWDVLPPIGKPQSGTDLPASGKLNDMFYKSGTGAGLYIWAGAAWESIRSLPDLTGNTGKYLTTDGTVTSWATVDALPSQSGNSGKYLTTDGTTASWAEGATPFTAKSTAYTLPVAPTEGFVVDIVGIGNNWIAMANTGQYIRYGSNLSASGGTLSSSQGYDCTTLIYIGDSTWLVKSSNGILTLDAG